MLAATKYLSWLKVVDIEAILGWEGFVPHSLVVNFFSSKQLFFFFFSWQKEFRVCGLRYGPTVGSDTKIDVAQDSSKVRKSRIP